MRMRHKPDQYIRYRSPSSYVLIKTTEVVICKVKEIYRLPLPPPTFFPLPGLPFFPIPPTLSPRFALAPSLAPADNAPPLLRIPRSESKPFALPLALFAAFFRSFADLGLVIGSPILGGFADFFAARIAAFVAREPARSAASSSLAIFRLLALRERPAKLSRFACEGDIIREPSVSPEFVNKPWEYLTFQLSC